MLELPARVTVVEVAPRDGLQSLGQQVPTATKIRMVDRLSEAGFPVIEVTGFAHPRAIPNLADAEAVMAGIARRPGITYRALAPNARGAERAVAAGAGEVLGLVTATESYTRRNQNMSVQAAAEGGASAFRIASDAGIPFVMAIGMAFWCPYEGVVPEERVEALVEGFHAAGIRRLYLAGSVGMEDPAHVNRLFRRLLSRWPELSLGYHVHDMGGAGLANVLAALDAGATSVEGACCGIGGGMTMPGSYGSVGNIPTEDLVQMLNDAGVDTGLPTATVQAAARDVAAMLGIAQRSRVGTVGTRADLLAREHP